MNLYKIVFKHIAPKGNDEGTKCLVLAKNDTSVFDWLKTEPQLGSDTLFNNWAEMEQYIWSEGKEAFVNPNDEDADEKYWYDENDNPQPFKDWIMRIEGEINDDSYDYSDSYYGITLLGWELMKENATSNYSELIELGFVIDLSCK